MIISIVGTHGVGKTTTINRIKERHPEWECVSEASRKIMPILGYDNPYRFVDEFGIAFYEAIIISQWNCLEIISKYQSPTVVILDRSPIDNLAYYYLHRTEQETIYERILLKLAQYYIHFIDRFIYIPSGVFKLNPDAMQRVDTQLLLNDIIVDLLNKLSIDYYTIHATNIDERTDETIKFIKENCTYEK